MTTSAARRGPRRWRRAAGIVLVGFVLALALVPFWFPWVLTAVARRFQVHVGNEERLGWSQIAWTDVRLEAGGLRLRADRLLLPQPHEWLRRLAGGGPPDLAVIRVSGWRAEVLSPVPPSTPSTNTTPAAVFGRLASGLGELAWLGGRVELTNGTIESGARRIDVPEAEIGPHGARVTAALEDWHAEASLRAQAGGAFGIQARLEPGQVRLQAELVPAPGGWRLGGTAWQATNHASFTAMFNPLDWIPETGTLMATNVGVRLPASAPGAISSDLLIGWDHGSGRATWKASGETTVPGDNRPRPIAADVRMNFGVQRAEIGELRLESPMLEMHLSAPVAMEFGSSWRIPKAELAFAANLTAIGRPDLRGQLSGHLQSAESRLENPTSFPALALQMSGSDLEVKGMALKRFEVGARLRGDRVRIEDVEAQFGNDSRFHAEGELDWRRRAVGGLTWKFDGKIPGIPGTTNLVLPAWTANGSMVGPITNLATRTHVESNGPLKIRGVRPLEVSADATSQGYALSELAMNAEADRARLSLGLSAVVNPAAPGSLRLRLVKAEIRESDAVELALEEPVEARLANVSGVAKTNWDAFELTVGDTRLRGEAGNLSVRTSVHWPEQGRVNLAARDVHASFLTNWAEHLPAVVSDTSLRVTDLAAQWNGGPLTARFHWNVETPLPEVGPATLRGSLEVTNSGVVLSTMQVLQNGESGLEASARLPVVIGFHPDGATVDGLDGPLEGKVRVASTGWPWQWIKARAGVSCVQPELNLTLGGTLQSPEIRLSVSANRVVVPLNGIEPGPLSIEGLELQGAADRSAIEVSKLHFRLDGQEIQARGRIPTIGAKDKEGWRGLRLADWRKVEAEGVIPKAELTPWTGAWRKTVQPGGELSANVRLSQGELHGWLNVTNVGLRPVPNVGSIRDLGLRIELDDHTISLARGSIAINGQPVDLGGRIEFDESGGYWGDLRLQGTNVAVLRSPEALLRADLDVSIQRTNGAANPTVGGTVTLHDGVVMMDVRDFVGINLEKPEQRPPYFSVDKQPVGDWALDLRLRGVRFARVASPAFRGTVSVDARLLGTLRDPRLLGEGVVDSGDITFPFGQLKVDQGRVRFTEAHPYEPQLEGRAEGMNFGYTITLNIAGTVSDPELRVSSVPPLSTREALQMLTAGTLPHSEYSFSESQKVQKVGAYLASDLISTITGNPSSESRLSLRSGQRVTTNGRLTYGMEYKLSDRWYLVGEYDRWSQFNAGVRWRVLEK